MDIKMIEVAVGILAAEPDKTKGLRNWAVDTLAHYSKDVELTDEAKNALREKPLPVYADAVFTATGVGRMEARINRRQPRGGGAHRADGEKFEIPMPPKKA